MGIESFKFLKVVQFLNESNAKVELNEEWSAPYHHKILSLLVKAREVPEKMVDNGSFNFLIFSFSSSVV
jgi:hypothetical protein